MTTIFAAAEYSIGLIDTLVQDEFFSTRKVAEDAVQQRILKNAIRNIKWTWQEREGKEGYWGREEDSFSFKLVVEERVVRDSLKDNSFIPLTPNDFTINTPLYYADLSDEAQGHFLSHQLMSYGVLSEGATDEEVIKQFLKLNFSGIPQSKKHMQYVESLYKKL